MILRSTLFVLSLITLASCAGDSSSTDQNFERYIKFNHLYVVLDSTTYNLISKDNQFLLDFSGVAETTSDTDDESWSGKYLYGKGHYLELFKLGGYPGAKAGDVGLGFMPTKMGTLDSLQKFWSQTSDSIDRKDRVVVEDGISYPWFSALSVRDADSLQLRVFLQENAKEDMIYTGFKEEALEKEIEYWDYMRYYRAKVRNTHPDSIQFGKLFEKVELIQLRLNQKELNLLARHLADFGFEQQGNIFHGNDIDISYEVDEKPHTILKGINFKLTESVKTEEHVLNKLRISLHGRSAEFRFQE